MAHTSALLERIENDEIDPSFVITHRAALEDGPELYKTFRDRKDGCIKVTATAEEGRRCLGRPSWPPGHERHAPRRTLPLPRGRLFQRDPRHKKFAPLQGNSARGLAAACSRLSRSRAISRHKRPSCSRLARALASAASAASRKHCSALCRYHPPTDIRRGYAITVNESDQIANWNRKARITKAQIRARPQA